MPNDDQLQPSAGFVLQKFLPGTPLGISFAARRGEMLAAFSYVKERTHPTRLGPTSVARIVDRPALLAIASRLVEHYRFMTHAATRP